MKVLPLQDYEKLMTLRQHYPERSDDKNLRYLIKTLKLKTAKEKNVLETLLQIQELIVTANGEILTTNTKLSKSNARKLIKHLSKKHYTQLKRMKGGLEIVLLFKNATEKNR